MSTASDLLIAELIRHGVDTVFGIPGVHNVELYRSLAGSGLRHVTPRHEQGAGFMADGYARASGRPAVCFVITGPGLTNIATAMAQSYGDSVPMLVVSAVNPHGRAGSGDGWLHELPDQRRIGGGVAAFSHTVSEPREIPQVVARAFALFQAGRPRPVHLDFPVDLMEAPAAAPRRDPAVLPHRPVPPPAAIAAAAEMLDGAEAPLILAGGGAIGGADAIGRLAERLDAPVVMTANARGLLPPAHPLAVSYGPSLAPVRALIAGADVVLSLGSELGPTDYDPYDEGPLAIRGRLLRVDIDPEQLVRSLNPDMALCGDAGATAEALLGRLPGAAARDRRGTSRAAACREAAEAALSAASRADIALLHRVRDASPEALLVGDSTRFVYAGNLGYAAARPRAWFNAATGYGALGYGLPAAIGAALAGNGRRVVCLAGDGGLQFSLAEMGTAAETGAPVTVLLLNNGGYGEIRAYMRGRNIPPLGVDLYTPDFQAIAKAYGWHTERLRDLADLEASLLRAAQAGGPALIEIVEPAG